MLGHAIEVLHCIRVQLTADSLNQRSRRAILRPGRSLTILVRRMILTITTASNMTAVAALDLDRLWDFSRPALSEQRFEQALQSANGDDVLILQTQIARTHGLRRDFEQARLRLEAIRPAVESAGPTARAHYHLELGRSLVSATHRAPELTPQAREQARAAYAKAMDAAREAGDDNLLIDAIHMMAFVDDDGPSQLRWNQQALAVLQGTTQPAARRWESSLRNNTGYALHQAGRLDEALAMFEANVALNERAGNPQRLRVAHWMVAWTLRSLGRIEDALAIQLRLERENDAAGQPDPYVYEELEHLYKARNDEPKAVHYADLLRAAKSKQKP